MRPFVLLPLLVLACDSAEIQVDDTADDDLDSDRVVDSDPGPVDTDPPQDTGEPADTADTEDTGPDTSMYDGATLEVREPQSASIHLLADGVPIDGVIRGATGQVLPFTDIEWSVRGSGEPPFVGRQAVATDIEAGIYTLDVQADLPNGDRLTQVINEVRVQSRLAGTWVGTARIVTTASFQGTPITSNCIGGIDLQIDLAAETVSGGGDCTVSLGGLGSFDIGLSIDGDIDDPDVSGSIDVGTGLLSNTLPWSGRFRGGLNNRTLEGAFQGTVGGLSLDGTIDARFVTPWGAP